MKQHITVEQFRELPSASQKVLRDWAKNHTSEKMPYLVYGEPRIDEDELFLVGDTKRKTSSDMQAGYAVLFTIGQMIEFLDKHTNMRAIWNNHSYGWVYQTEEQATSNAAHVPDSYKELCDALWQAIKEVLGREK